MKNTRNKKKIVTLLVLTIVLSTLVVGCTKDKPKEANPDTDKNKLEDVVDEVTDIGKITYNVEIAKEDAFLLGNSKGLTIDVLVKEELGVKEMKEVAQSIVKDKKEDGTVFNGIMIIFNDKKEFIGEGATLGMVTYAPEGDLQKGADIEPGDHSTMEFKYELKEKNWSLKPTRNEFDIYREWIRLRNLKTEDGTLKEETFNKYVADELKIEVMDVQEAVGSHIEWNINDISNEGK